MVVVFVGVPFGFQFPAVPHAPETVLFHAAAAAHEFAGKPNKSNAATKTPFVKTELTGADDNRRAGLELIECMEIGTNRCKAMQSILSSFY